MSIDKLDGKAEYILKSKTGIEGTFNLLKFDTLYTTIDRGVGVKYFGNGSNFVKAYFRVKSTFVLNILLSGLSNQ